MGFILPGGVAMGPSIRSTLILTCLSAAVSAAIAGEGGSPEQTRDVQTASGTLRPTTLPSTQPIPPVRLKTIHSTLSRLASEDAIKREEARHELMGLQRADLPALKQAIRLALPLEPSQSAVLRDIVTHVYLSGDSYSSQGDGFLGVTLPNYLYPEQRALLSLERGVAVVTRLPGFCAFRMLQDGDIIISLSSHPDVEFKTPEQLTAIVKTARAGQTVTFDVIRHGQIVKVPVNLDRRPTGIDTVGTFTDDRARAAEELWERDFAPLLAGTNLS